MRKLTLKLDALQVETFETTRTEDAGTGTVRGYNGFSDQAGFTYCCFTGGVCTQVNGACNTGECATFATCAGGGVGCPPKMDDPTV